MENTELKRIARTIRELYEAADSVCLPDYVYEDVVSRIMELSDTLAMLILDDDEQADE